MKYSYSNVPEQIVNIRVLENLLDPLIVVVIHMNLHFILYYMKLFDFILEETSCLISCLKFVCPSSWRLHFIQSEFRGQLPQPYGSGPLATQTIPANMNDQNLEETSRYVRNFSGSGRGRSSCRDLNWLLCFPCR